MWIYEYMQTCIFSQKVFQNQRPLQIPNQVWWILVKTPMDFRSPNCLKHSMGPSNPLDKLEANGLSTEKNTCEVTL